MELHSTAEDKSELIFAQALRSRVAFGLIDILEAKREAENLLLGPPRQNYLTVKANAIIGSLNNRKRAAEESVAQMDRIISLASELKLKPGDPKLLQEASLEKRLAFGNIKAFIKKNEGHKKEAQKIHLELQLRAKIARELLGMSAREVDAVLSRVGATARASDSASTQIATRIENFKAALKTLEASLKDHHGDKGQLLTLRELLKGLFLK